ncbi:MAG: leucyl/phenylalanyl-tRNA--protein transferase [Acidimicrobiales bacterium]|nr:leucyl/phenylalanyl-tRNA--protein transferase [Acidimicrobiales bacterium]
MTDPGSRPTEPEPNTWLFPPANTADEHGMVAIGADVTPGTLLAAYRSGLFPMPIEPGGLMGWWSPNPRGVLHPKQLKVSRSLRRSRQHFEIRVNTAFAEVMDACADPSRPQGWIDEQIMAAYLALHQLGWAHSIEAWDDQGLAGGLYGIAVGGLFAGESMFHRRPDASKVALMGLVELMAPQAEWLIDVQWLTDHLATLGCIEMTRDDYLAVLPMLVSGPGLLWPGGV